MPFKKGESGNPKGRPPSPVIVELKEAIESVETEKGKKLLHHAIEQAYSDNRVLVAILRKIIPDLKTVNAVDERDHNLKIIVTDDSSTDLSIEEIEEEMRKRGIPIPR